MSPCEHIKFPDGSVAIVRFAKRRGKKCAFCHLQATRECDYELGRTLDGRVITCDAPICASCAKPIGENKDLCPRHS